MKAEPRVLLALLVALAVATGGCGGDEEAFRIGVLTDCVGIYRALNDAQLSGAQLPLLERGAKLRGSRPGDGITSGEVAGRPVELVRGCTETGEFSTMFEQVRRLVEQETVDAVIGGSFGVDALGMREVARNYPATVFIALPNGAREATLRDRTPNLYRLAADHGQGVAGLGTYAYRDLGWRKAALIAMNWDAGWGSAAAFVAEFCALGGHVTKQQRVDFVDPSGADADRVPRDIDGVAVLTTSFAGTQGALLQKLATRARAPARHIVLAPAVLGEEAALRTAGQALEGVVGAARYLAPGASEEMDAYLERYREAFPGLPAELARDEFVIAFRNAVEGLLQALERAEGDIGEDARGLHRELGRLETTLLGTPVRIDENGQAVITTSLVRLGKPGANGVPVLEPLREIEGVDQSIGGLLDDDYSPADRDEPCRKAQPPPWAR